MKRRRTIRVLLVLCCILAVGAVAWALRPKEPTYAGKTSKEWFLSISTTSSVPNRIEIFDDDPALEALFNLGTNAVPFLMREYRGRNQRVESVVEWANRWFDLKLLSSDDRSFRASVCLAKLGPKAELAVPELIERANDQSSSYRLDAMELLGKIHARPEITIPTLEHILIKDRTFEFCAVHALGEFGPQAKSSVPALISLWQTLTNSQQRSLVEGSLRKIDPQAAAKAGIK